MAANHKTVDNETNEQHKLALATEALEELKGEALQVLDIRELTTIAEHMVICTGSTARHVKRLGQTVIEKTKSAGLQPRVEGLEQAEWVLIDLNGVLVHIMQPTTRAYYQIEKLWDIDLAIQPANEQ